MAGRGGNNKECGDESYVRSLELHDGFFFWDEAFWSRFDKAGLSD